eukprot:7714865-Prorocentrum_lima.AAC.1
MTIQTLGRYMTRAFAALQIPTAWTHTYATLIPKIVHPTQTSQFRAIAHLTAIRKLVSYMWLQLLPPLKYKTLQCGFVPRVQAAEG